jgi:integrase
MTLGGKMVADRQHMGSSFVVANQPQISPPASVSDFVTQSLSAASKRAYQADMSHFMAWGGTLPSSPELVARYIADHAQTHKVATLRRWLASLSKAHQLAGEINPVSSGLVKATLRGIRRTLGTAQREAKPLLRDDLFAILERMGNRPIDMRDRALMLIGFAGAFRRSELVALDVADIEHVRQGVVINLRFSKTDQDGKGRKIGIPFGRTHWCPVNHLTEWLQLASITEGPLFRPVAKSGEIMPERLSGEAVGLIIKKHVATIGLNADAYSGHSIRAGLATSAASAGASAWKIRQQTGHASDAMLNRYIRDGELFNGNASGCVL